MSLLDRKIFIADAEKLMNGYVPADTVKRIVADLSEELTRYELNRIITTDGADWRIDSKQMVRLYLDAKEIEGKSKNTLERYEYILNRLVDALDVPIPKVTVYHLRQYMMAEKSRGISMNTIKGNCYIYSGFFGWLHNEGLIANDPTSTIGQIKAVVEKEIPFTSGEIQLMKEACENEQQSAIIHFLLSTGCRISEVCSVNRADIDYKTLKLQVTGKGNKIRTVYIDDVTALMLKRYLATRTDFNPALFYSRNRQRYTPCGIRFMLKQIEKRSHVPNVHPHRFRRTLATGLVDRGMNIQEVATILGHSKIDTTMTYINVNEKNTENSYRKYACM